MRIFICDTCGQRIMDGTFGSPALGTDYCSPECMPGNVVADDGCPHEENIDGTTHSTDGKRLICTACGYDRVEAVEETVI